MHEIYDYKAANLVYMLLAYNISTASMYFCKLGINFIMKVLTTKRMFLKTVVFKHPQKYFSSKSIFS